MKPRRQPWTQRPAPGVSHASRMGGEATGVRLRNDWEALAAKVRAACVLSGALDDPETLLALKHLVARTGHADPPFEAAPARTAAAGFRLMAEAMTQSHPERRAAMAEALIAGALLVDALLTEERTRAARVWQHRSGGD